MSLAIISCSVVGCTLECGTSGRQSFFCSSSGLVIWFRLLSSTTLALGSSIVSFGLSRFCLRPLLIWEVCITTVGFRNLRLHLIEYLKSEAKKRDNFKYCWKIKNPQFLSYPHETWQKYSPHEVIIFTKFHEDRTKIVDFLSMANFWKCPVLFLQTLLYRLDEKIKMKSVNKILEVKSEEKNGALSKIDHW